MPLDSGLYAGVVTFRNHLSLEVDREDPATIGRLRDFRRFRLPFRVQFWIRRCLAELGSKVPAATGADSSLPRGVNLTPPSVRLSRDKFVFLFRAFHDRL
jgi:hypothetical protein